MVRNRTFDEVSRRLGPIDQVIADIIERNGSATILEIGAGAGIVMRQMIARFPGRLTVFGLNRQYHHGNREVLAEELTASGLSGGDHNGAAASGDAPIYLCADAGVSLPLRDDSVDFVYSQATIPFIADKAELVNEINRILKPGCHARVQVNLHPRFLLGDSESLFQIERDGVRQSIESYAGDADGITAARSPGGVIYMRIEKRRAPPLRLESVSYTQVGDPECPYVESVYALAG